MNYLQIAAFAVQIISSAFWFALGVIWLRSR